MTPRLAPTLLAGVVGAGAAAIGAGRELAAADAGDAAIPALAAATAATLPVAQALALVTLACWGVVLVSRGFARRSVAALGLLAALACLTSVLFGASSVPEAVTEQLAAGDQSSVHLTGWFWVTLAGAAVSVAATAMMFRAVPTWPEMGRRYDAPGATTHTTTSDPSEATNTDLWRAMDEGRDPTD